MKKQLTLSLMMLLFAVLFGSNKVKALYFTKVNFTQKTQICGGDTATTIVLRIQSPYYDTARVDCIDIDPYYFYPINYIDSLFVYEGNIIILRKKVVNYYDSQLDLSNRLIAPGEDIVWRVVIKTLKGINTTLPAMRLTEASYSIQYPDIGTRSGVWYFYSNCVSSGVLNINDCTPLFKMKFTVNPTAPSQTCAGKIINVMDITIENPNMEIHRIDMLHFRTKNPIKTIQGCKMDSVFIYDGKDSLIGCNLVVNNEAYVAINKIIPSHSISTFKIATKISLMNYPLLRNLYLLFDTLYWTYDNNSSKVLCTNILMNSNIDIVNCSTLAKKEITGTKELDGLEFVKVYPNPFTNQLNIDNENGSKVFFIDIQGRVVFEKLLESNKEQLDLNLPAGIYFVNILNGEKVSRYKIIKI